MAITYTCDNPSCATDFRIEEEEVYCPVCEQIHKRWKKHSVERSAEYAEQFATEMEVEKAEFFKKETPSRGGGNGRAAPQAKRPSILNAATAHSR
jgi:uncharacterized Zn finger protein (UPF0148 family)